jgi:hypothetical protein
MLPGDVMATGPLGQQWATISSAPTRNHYTKKCIKSITNEVNGKIYPYLNPIKPRRKARAEGGMLL